MLIVAGSLSLAAARVGLGEEAVDASNRVSEFVEPYLKNKQIPGCAIMVRYNGKIALCAGYGIANLEDKVPVTAKTVFQSGSIGKQFTAAAVMLLVRDGKLSLDDKVGKYLDVPQSWSGITVRNLLNHTSGLGDYPESFSLTRDYSEDELLKMVTSQSLDFAPGERWSYSNLGYVTLGILIHRVSGRSYSEFLRDTDFSASRHDEQPCDQRRRYHFASRRWLPLQRWRAEKSGVGRADGEHNSRRQSVSHR